jgi:hypothetical protein
MEIFPLSVGIGVPFCYKKRLRKSFHTNQKKVQDDTYATNVSYPLLVSPIHLRGVPRINNYLLHLLSKWSLSVILCNL